MSKKSRANEAAQVLAKAREAAHNSSALHALEEASAAHQLWSSARADVDRWALEALDRGASWAAVGRALNMTRQSVRARYLRRAQLQHLIAEGNGA